MRQANELPPLPTEQFQAEADEIRVLRSTIRQQLRADLDRVDRCLVILDAIEGDADIEQDAGEMPEGVWSGGAVATEDDEPSLGSLTSCSGCGQQAGWGGGGTDDREGDDEREPSLASLGGTAAGCEQSQGGWAKGNRRDLEIDTGARTHRQRPDDPYACDPASALTKARAAIEKRRDDTERTRYAAQRPVVVSLFGGRR